MISAAGSKFPKSKRLLRHADFQLVYETGRRQFTGNMTVFFLRRAGSGKESAAGSALRVGFTVGRALGDAVDRNRIKRRMRAAVRSSWPADDAPIDVVFNPRKSVLDLAFTDVVSEVSRGLQLALQRARESAPESPKAARETAKRSRRTQTRQPGAERPKRT